MGNCKIAYLPPKQIEINLVYHTNGIFTSTNPKNRPFAHGIDQFVFQLMSYVRPAGETSRYCLQIPPFCQTPYRKKKDTRLRNANKFRSLRNQCAHWLWQSPQQRLTCHSNKPQPRGEIFAPKKFGKYVTMGI